MGIDQSLAVRMDRSSAYHPGLSSPAERGKGDSGLLRWSLQLSVIVTEVLAECFRTGFQASPGNGRMLKRGMGE